MGVVIMEVNYDMVLCESVSQTLPERVNYNEICESVSQTLPERVNQIYNYIYIKLYRPI